jgi:hypothetical protein
MSALPSFSVLEMSSISSIRMMTASFAPNMTEIIGAGPTGLKTKETTKLFYLRTAFYFFKWIFVNAKTLL